MQLLTNALPGFRHLRAPLVAGYLWLVLLWIVLRPNVHAKPNNVIAAAIYDLGKDVGPLWVGLAIGTAAYFVGSISQGMTSRRFSTFLGAVMTDSTRALQKLSALPFSSRREGYVPQTLSYHSTARSRIDDSPIDRLREEAEERYKRLPLRGMRKEEDNFEQELGARASDAARGLERERQLPSTLLLGKEPELFSEADRLKAEAELRLSVTPPLLAIVAFLAINQSPWWWLGLIVIAILFVQAYNRNEDFSKLMDAALQFDLVRSQSIESLESWINDTLAHTEEVNRAKQEAESRRAV